jgi:hypothetical protein
LPRFRFAGVAGVRISAAGLTGNDSVWLGLLAACFKGAADLKVILFSTSFLGLQQMPPH